MVYEPVKEMYEAENYGFISDTDRFIQGKEKKGS